MVADKRKYFLRWPERAYTIRSDTLLARCANSRCMVSGVYDWIVRSLARNRQSQGAARFTYTITIGTDPKVEPKTGKSSANAGFAARQPHWLQQTRR